MEICLAVLCGYLLDLILGDPHWLLHPVQVMGWCISGAEKLLRRVFPKTPRGELCGGAVLAVGMVLLGFFVPFGILYAAGLIHPALRFGLEVLFCYQIPATKSLRTESMRVYEPLKNADLPLARHYLSWIVGRDTQNLDEEHVAKAAVETVAENTSDGIVAPLFYLVIGGAPLGFLYKAINTMDSMIGYKNDRYLYFGRAAAKLDDAVNFIPAILSAWLMIAASCLLGLDGKNACRIYQRDHKNHSSPNSARTESVCAGALGVQLAGDAFYFGKLVHKPTIGDPGRPVTAQDIPLACRLMTMTSVLSLCLFLAVRLAGVLLW
ncbi:MAG: adenosylcobinamide-phosphate synthase CbiB [Oscillospiraceae bacterium]